MSDCLQYYYDNPEDAEKYNIDCKKRTFEDLKSVENFTNKNLLEFIDTEYSSKAFPENSPFEFKDDYIDLTNTEICNSADMSLAPQQKFMGQLMGPNSNFNNVLIYHGLGSGKSCTSIVIGEALKNASNQRMLYVVPAPLVDQYYEEITGEIRNGKFFSCPSFCLVKKDGEYERDFYVSQNQNSILLGKSRNVEKESNKLFDLQVMIDSGDNSPATTKAYKTQENLLALRKRDLSNYQKDLRNKIVRTFEIVSHQTFIESIYKTSKDGNFIKNKRLLEDSALFHENGLLIIDEIQRLVSEGGTFYKKIYDAIKYYFHPKLKLALLSATPIYDNPYELALTMNLLRPRMPFPIDKSEFYKTFIGVLDEDGNCKVTDESKTWVTEDSCVINKDLVSYLCSGYVSYFKGGNPNAYPYKRIINLEHVFSLKHKIEYISALKSDLSKDKNFLQNSGRGVDSYENVLLGNYETSSEDNVSGMYVTTQQYSNIFLPKVGENINRTVVEKKRALEIFKSDIKKQRFENRIDIINYVKTFSKKFASIIELSLNSTGPVFIFSNWLTFGVEPLSIILEACGLVSFEKQDRGYGKYFLWSSETKTKDKDGTLIKKARSTFNSVENNDGSLLKIILGTRSVMEGVSFKNVKQVHITEPWWNESRIEQILARASRYCSHSSLPAEEQHVDIYRHYSVFPSSGTSQDEDVLEMLKEVGRPNGWKQYEIFGIDQKMLMAAIKKYSINTELNTILKSCSIDSNINRNGNLIRLEENVIPLPNGSFQIYYKNPSNGRMYIREGIPEEVSFTDVYSRRYSYPNKDFPIKFTEAGQSETGKFTTYPDSEVLTEPTINKDLNMLEDVEVWNSNKTFKDLELSQTTKDASLALYNKYELIPTLRKNYFNETGDSVISFKDDPKKRINLIKCIKQLAVSDLVSKSVKKDIAKEFNKESVKQRLNEKVLEIIYVHKIYPESYLQELLDVAISNPEAINEMLKTVSKK